MDRPPGDQPLVTERDLDDDAHPATSATHGRTSARRAVTLVVVTLLAGLLLDSGAVVRQGRALPEGLTHDAVLAVGLPLDHVARTVGLSRPADALDSAFGHDATAADGEPGLAAAAAAEPDDPDATSDDATSDGGAGASGTDGSGAPGGDADGSGNAKATGGGGGSTGVATAPARSGTASPSATGRAGSDVPPSATAKPHPGAAVVAGPRGDARWPTPSKAHPLQLLVTGDSLSDYVGDQVANLAAPAGLVTVTTQYRNGTGLTNPDFFDWSVEARRQVRELHPDAVVVVMGGNDGWNLEVGGRAYGANSDEWQAEYRRRVAAVMRIYSQGGTRPVYWSTPPVPQDPKWAKIFARQAEAAAAAARTVPGARWVDLATTSAVDGRYSRYLTWHGHRVDARQPDGIHWSYDGAVIPADAILHALAADLGRVR